MARERSFFRVKLLSGAAQMPHVSMNERKGIAVNRAHVEKGNWPGTKWRTEKASA
jgi:hypothetical protein